MSGSEIEVLINATLDTKIHTSCSQPILIGMTFGNFTIIDGESRHGGQICSIGGGPNCGDGTVDAGEQCDDGNLIPGDGCDIACVIEPGWKCIGGPSVCSPICGDSLLVGGEQCDDGNTNNGDCCDSTCQNEPPGSQICGFGVCQTTTNQCLNGAPVTCIPGNPAEFPKELSCNNGDDDDCDGLTDLLDPDCGGPGGPVCGKLGVERLSILMVGWRAWKVV